MKPRVGRRRGSTLAMVLGLFLALGSVLGAAVTLAAVSAGAAEREYRRSQALALAEAGVAEALAGGAPHGPRALGDGTYEWRADPAGGGRRVIAVGRVASGRGREVAREVRALVAGRRILEWREGLPPAEAPQ
jgi:hypothetical protein